MRGFSENCAHMDVRTYGGESKGPSTPSRDQKSTWNIILALTSPKSVKSFRKSNERFPRKSVANGRVYVRT